MSVAGADDVECEQCAAGARFRVVELVIDAPGRDGGTHRFCSDTCESRWLKARLTRQLKYANRIYVSVRGRGHDIAHVALHTNEAP